MDRIVVGTDFSEPSLQAVRAAAAWARRMGSELVLVHGYDPAPPRATALLPGRMWPTLDVAAKEEELRGDLTRLRNDCAAGIERVSLEIVPHASAAVALCDRAANADLVVVGTHGRTGIRRLMLGSVAEQVVRHSPAPVLVARAGAEAPRRALVGTDLSAAAAAAVDLASAIDEQLGLEITLAHVFGDAWWHGRIDPADAALEAELTAELAKLHGGRHRAAVVRGENPAESLTRLAEEKGFDLIIVSTHGLTGIDRMIIGSVAERVTRHASCSVLVARAGRISWVAPAP